MLEICENPIFVVGAPRSGTSTLQWALAEHKELWTSPNDSWVGEHPDGDSAHGALRHTALAGFLRRSRAGGR